MLLLNLILLYQGYLTMVWVSPISILDYWFFNPQSQCWNSLPCFLLFFLQFPVVTDIQYTYQNKAFFKVYNFCIYITINIWHHETFFPFFTKSRDFTFSYSYISRTLYFFIMCIISLKSSDKKESFDILNSIV